LDITGGSIGQRYFSGDAPGGGVKISGVANFEGCNIYDNTAWSDGGGVFVDYNGVANFEGSNIHNNTAYGAGGGVRVKTRGVAHFVSCNIHDNTVIGSVGWGGGVYVTFGTTNFEGCNIHDNTAPWGGGLYAGQWSRSFTWRLAMLTNTDVYSNTATVGRGGGVCIHFNAAVHFEGCKIHNNTARTSGGGLQISGSAELTGNTRVHSNNASSGHNIHVRMISGVA